MIQKTISASSTMLLEYCRSYRVPAVGIWPYSASTETTTLTASWTENHIRNPDNVLKGSTWQDSAPSLVPTVVLQIDGILTKGPYPPCLHMADRALWAGYPRNIEGMSGQDTHLPTAPHYSMDCLERVDLEHAPYMYRVRSVHWHFQEHAEDESV